MKRRNALACVNSRGPTESISRGFKAPRRAAPNDLAQAKLKQKAELAEAWASAPWVDGAIPPVIHDAIYRALQLSDVSDTEMTATRLNAMRNPDEPVCSFVIGKNPATGEMTLKTEHRFPVLYGLLKRLMDTQDAQHPWSTITINHNFRCARHLDSSNRYGIGFLTLPKL
jgi:hypothetical protein